eukprot:PhF_6_TR44514/c0_g1_i2/m.68565/K13989/DERL2_3; Derlin-2/3
MAQSFEAWWASLGPIPKGSVILPLAIGLSVSLGIAAPYLFILDWNAVYEDFEIWRLVTSCVFFGKLSFGFMMNLAMFVVYQKRHEEDFGGRLADHVYMLLVLWIAFLIVAFIFSMMVISFALTMSLIWIWCKRHEDQMLSIYGFAFKAQHFPWVMVLLHIAFGNSIVDDLIGIGVGHLYFFVKDVLPQTNGMRLLETPQWIRTQLPDSTQNVFGVHIPQQRQTAPAQNVNRQWGGGRALGGN